MTPALTILIVDRDEDVFKILNEQLAATNSALLHARNGTEATALLERLKFKIELAIVDLAFPDQDGWELIGRLAHQDPRPAKIIATVLSDYSSLALENQIKEALGGDLVVLKPIHTRSGTTLATLISRV